MKKIALFFIIIASFTTSFAHPPTDWMYLVTKDQFGVITKATTYADMINLFGKDKLKGETHTGPEGEGILKCTVVYKGTELEMTVYWDDKNWHKKISSVECTKRNSPYYTEEKLKVGSTLNTLVKVNKAFVTFYGFGWDYGGIISDYHKGTLEKKKVNFTLDWNGKNDNTLLGDGEFNSQMPKVIKRAAEIYIAKIAVSFF
jgi:hypothetical protein